MYIFHTSKKNDNKGEVNFSPVLKKNLKNSRGGGSFKLPILRNYLLFRKKLFWTKSILRHTKITTNSKIESIKYWPIIIFHY